MILTFYQSNGSAPVARIEIDTETAILKSIDYENKLVWELPIYECSWEFTKIQSLEHLFELVIDKGCEAWRQEANRYFDSHFLE